MRKTMLMSALAMSFVAPAAFAQSTPVPAAPPSPSQVPAETTAPAMGAMHDGMKPRSHMRHATAAADIRPGHEPGVGESEPASTKASNIAAGDTKSAIAPRLPAPAGGANASPQMLLSDAEKALDARQSGRAQEALERAETAMLQRSVPATEASQPDMSGGVRQVQMAREALAKGDMAGAKRAIAAAMQAG